MGKRITGKDMRFTLGKYMVCVENFTLNIEDSTTVAMTRGVPNGWIDGDTKGSGEIELDTANFQVVLDAAKSAGGFKSLPTFDVVGNAETDVEKINIEAFGCKFRISDLMNAAGSGGDKLKYKLPYDVTDSDFVKINGVPYLSASETENLI